MSSLMFLKVTDDTVKLAPYKNYQIFSLDGKFYVSLGETDLILGVETHECFKCDSIAEAHYRIDDLECHKQNEENPVVHDNPEWLSDAQRNMPEGKICHFCGKENDFADDCGWFFISPTDDNRGCCCRACYHGEPGQRHIARYGVGER